MTPAEGETAREAAIRTILDGTAASRRVDIHTPSGAILHVLAEPGRLSVLGQSRSPEVATASPEVGLTPDDWPERDHAWPVPAPSCPDGPGHVATPASLLRPRVVRLRRPSRRAVAATAALGIVAGVVAAATEFLDTDGATGSVSSQSRQAGTSASPVSFPGAVPDGVTGDVIWTSPALLPESGVAVSTGPSAVVTVLTHDRTLAALDAATGESRWAVPLPDGDVVRGPGATRASGRAAVAMQVGNRVLAWSAADGTPILDVTVPADGRLSLDGVAPLVRIGNDQALAPGAGSAPVSIPAGARALAAREDGTVLAANGQGWWHLGPGTPAGPPTPWEQMASTPEAAHRSLQVVGALGPAVLLLDDDPAGPRVLVHHDGAVARASFQGASVSTERATWAPSPSATWGILGRSLVDLHAGEVTDLGAWRTVLIAHDRAYGLIGDVLHVVRPGAPPTPVRTRTALIEATTGAGAIVRAETPSGPRVWLLRRSGI